MSKQTTNITDLTFNWDALTIGDLIVLLQAAANSDVSSFLVVAHKCAVGGITHLPMRLYESVINRLAAEFAEQVVAWRAGITPETSNIAQLLRQALGGQGDGSGEST
jgi:hypothetical protein